MVWALILILDWNGRAFIETIPVETQHLCTIALQHVNESTPKPVDKAFCMKIRED